MHAWYKGTTVRGTSLKVITKRHLQDTFYIARRRAQFTIRPLVRSKTQSPVVGCDEPQ